MSKEEDSLAADGLSTPADSPFHSLTFLGGADEFGEFEDRVLRHLVDAVRGCVADQERLGVLTDIRDSLANARKLGKTFNLYQDQFRISSQEIGWLKTHGEERWVDYLVSRYRLRMYPVRKQLTPFPLHLLIEPTPVCNLRCVMCFQVDPAFDRDPALKGVMNWDLFVNVVDQAADHGCNAITLASRGEPTLHKRLGDMLAYLSQKKIMEVKLNTNATRLGEALCHQILSAGVNTVVFSVDASTKESYEKIRVRGIFETVLANIQRFKEIRDKEYPGSPTVTRISGVKVDPDQNLEEMGSFWSRWVDEVTIVDNVPRWDTYNNLGSGRTTACNMLWERMYVWFDGSCNVCDFDYKSLLSPGNARERSLSEIWLGEAYTKLRQQHLAKERKCAVPCDRCPL